MTVVTGFLSVLILGSPRGVSQIAEVAGHEIFSVLEPHAIDGRRYGGAVPSRVMRSTRPAAAP